MVIYKCRIRRGKKTPIDTKHTEGTLMTVKKPQTRLLRGLFLETSADSQSVAYTMAELYDHYMRTDDPTEYTFATKYLVDYEHWRMLTECNWFKPHVERWRDELQIRMTQRALDIIRRDANDPDSKTSVQSAKYIAEEKWKKESRAPVGRPKKSEAEDIGVSTTHQEETIEEDLDRILN